MPQTAESDVFEDLSAGEVAEYLGVRQEVVAALQSLLRQRLHSNRWRILCLKMRPYWISRLQLQRSMSQLPVWPVGTLVLAESQTAVVGSAAVGVAGSSSFAWSGKSAIFWSSWWGIRFGRWIRHARFSTDGLAGNGARKSRWPYQPAFVPLYQDRHLLCAMRKRWNGKSSWWSSDWRGGGGYCFADRCSG